MFGINEEKTDGMPHHPSSAYESIKVSGVAIPQYGKVWIDFHCREICCGVRV
jgi:hypothetical protein